jgi:hypothetical protein
MEPEIREMVKTPNYKHIYVKIMIKLHIIRRLNNKMTQSVKLNKGVCQDSNNIQYIEAVPLQAWSGPEGSRKLRFPDFMTTAQNGGKVVSLTHQLPLPPGNTPGAHFC